MKLFPTNPLYRNDYVRGYIKGLVTGMLAVILAVALNWTIKHWKAVLVTVQNPEVVADLQIDTKLVLKK